MTDLEKLVLDAKNNDIKIEVRFEVRPVWKLPIIHDNMDESIRRNQIEAKFKVFSYEIERSFRRLIEAIGG